MTIAADVLDEVYLYWFGDLKSPEDRPPEQRVTEWFRPTEAIDDHIRATFGRHLDPVRDTEWELEALTRRQQVGLVVLLDQFPRQIDRKTSAAFACDAKALSIAKTLVAGGRERFFPVERPFVYLPFEHSELVADQDFAVQLFAELAVQAPDGSKDGVRSALDYATKHRDIIRKFGRFPHRNAMLGREFDGGRGRVPERWPGILARDCDFAELDHRLDVGVVGDVALQERGMRSERGHEVLGRLEHVLAHGDIGGWRARCAATDAAIDRHAAEALGDAQPCDRRRHVGLQIIGYVENGHPACSDRRC